MKIREAAEKIYPRIDHNIKFKNTTISLEYLYEEEIIRISKIIQRLIDCGISRDASEIAHVVEVFKPEENMICSDCGIHYRYCRCESGMCGACGEQLSECGACAKED